MFVLYCVCTSSLGWRFLPAAVHCRSSSVNKLWVSWFGRHLFLWSMWTLRKMHLLSACSLCAVSNCNPSDCTANCMTAVEFFLCWRATLHTFGHLEHLETRLKLTHSRTLEYRGAFLSYRSELKIFLVECGCQVCLMLLFLKKNVLNWLVFWQNCWRSLFTFD